MDLLALLNGLVQQLADAQKAANDLAAAKFAEGVSSRDQEVADLKAKIAELEASVPSGKSYSQAELDAALASAIAPLQAQIDGFQAVVDGKVADAVSALKADLKKSYSDLKVAEQPLETGFASKLD